MRHPDVADAQQVVASHVVRDAELDALVRATAMPAIQRKRILLEVDHVSPLTVVAALRN